MITPFDSIFDFNHDGKLDGLERISRDGLIMHILDDTEQNNSLIEAGIDPYEFDWMSDAEKAETPDADDFDF